MFQPFETEKKNRIFNKRFWVGFWLGVSVFIVLNVVAYFYADHYFQHDLWRAGTIAPAPRFVWGFPFSWEADRLLGIAGGPLNLLVAALFGFGFGTIARSVRLGNTVRS
ncbi:MAG TPA: hypothetical protein DEP46_06970 [Blastocatellia bacterium]|nr:hypothetical protein [Blastocatellia bacterium]